MRIKVSPRRERQTRQKCEGCVRLHVRELSRRNLLAAGASTYLHLKAAQGTRSALLRVRGLGQHVELMHSRGVSGEKCCYRVHIEWQPCHFGGQRPWLRCPRCGSRRAVLFGFAPDGLFGCWGCMDVVYASQDARKMERLWGQQSKLECKLDAWCRTPQRIPWRKLRTVCALLDEVLLKQDRLFCEGARALFKRRGWS